MFRLKFVISFPLENEDNILTEQLYRIFSRYPFPSGMEGCPCCVSDEHLKKLRSKPLRQLGDEELSRYTFKAMTTWGTEQDFKYYLPRIAELYLSGSNYIDSGLVLNKITSAGWTTWPADEQEVIREFVLNWWNGLTTDYNVHLYESISDFLGDPGILLEKWKVNMASESFRTFIDMAETNYYQLRDVSLRQWIRSKQQLMEEAFFYYEKNDPVFAQRISNVLYTMERI